MNIALVVDRVDKGNGTAHMNLALAREFVKLGHEVHIYAGTGALPASTPRLAYHRIPCLRGSWRIWSLPLGARLALPLRRHDVVVSSVLTLDQDIIVMHNDPQPVEQRKLEAAPFEMLRPELRTWRRRLRAFIERRRFEPGRYRGVIALSRRSAGEIAQAFSVDPARLDVIAHGIDSDRFSPRLREASRAEQRRRLGIADEEVVFLYIGDYWKGLEFGLRALARLRASKVRLLAVGPFDPKPFHALSRKLGVALTCRRTEPDARVFYAAADVLFHPTVLDTFGLCVLEAMSMGLPALVSGRAGVAELLTHGENAWLVDDPLDLAQLAAGARALQDASARLRLGLGARELAGRHGWEQAARSHLAVYRRVAAEKARSVARFEA